MPMPTAHAYACAYAHAYACHMLMLKGCLLYANAIWYTLPCYDCKKHRHRA